MQVLQIRLTHWFRQLYSIQEIHISNYGVVTEIVNPYQISNTTPQKFQTYVEAEVFQLRSQLQS